MAWIDDRIYCHPKLMRVSKAARWTWVAGNAYSAGWQTHGRLERGEQEAIGSTPAIRRELVAAHLWHAAENGAIEINDWDEHNSKRDARREADRERKRLARSNGTSAGQSAGRSTGRSTVSARVEGSEGSDE